jgi:hypothetical protein
MLRIGSRFMACAKDKPCSGSQLHVIEAEAA